MGVLCHNNQNKIAEILTNSRSKLKSGAMACHQYANWDKLEQYGWEKGGVPTEFRDLPDDEIWWPRNTQTDMVAMSTKAGWSVEDPDMNLLRRDSIIHLRNQE